VIDGSDDMISRKDMPFWSFVDIAAHLGCHILSKQVSGGTNERFKAKRAKNSNFHISETAAVIATKFCTVINITKYSSRVVEVCPKQSKMADGRHLEKLLHFCNLLTDFNEILHNASQLP